MWALRCAKGLAFGGVIAVISCGWGQTTTGGAKGVGESTTASVVISLVAIFVVDFFLSMIFLTSEIDLANGRMASHKEKFVIKSSAHLQRAD